MDKKIVKYSALYSIAVGQSATVVPVDHTNPLRGEDDPRRVVNGQVAYTSAVQSYDETTGIFETRNSIYVPA